MNQGIEWQLTSLEWSQKLKELGVDTDSLFYWCHSQKQGWFVMSDVRQILKDESGFLEEVYNAYSVAELGEMLPEGYATYVAPHQNKLAPAKWKCICPLPDPGVIDQYADTEADARAKMLCYLLENGIIKLSPPLH